MRPGDIVRSISGKSWICAFTAPPELLHGWQPGPYWLLVKTEKDDDADDDTIVFGLAHENDLASDMRGQASFEAGEPLIWEGEVTHVVADHSLFVVVRMGTEVFALWAWQARLMQVRGWRRPISFLCSDTRNASMEEV